MHLYTPTPYYIYVHDVRCLINVVLYLLLWNVVVNKKKKNKKLSLHSECAYIPNLRVFVLLWVLYIRTIRKYNARVYAYTHYNTYVIKRVRRTRQCVGSRRLCITISFSTLAPRGTKMFVRAYIIVKRTRHTFAESTMTNDNLFVFLLLSRRFHRAL